MDDSSTETVAGDRTTQTMDSTSAGNTESTSIKPTSSDSSTSVNITSSKVGKTTLQTSSDVPYTHSTQFPMQHPTQMLPSNQIPIATTDPVSLTSSDVQGQVLQSDFIHSGSIESSLSSESETIETAKESKSVIPTKSSVFESSNADKSDSVLVSSVDDDYKSSDGDINTVNHGITNSQSDTVNSVDSILTSTSEVDILPSKSETSAVMTGAVYSTNKPTTFSSAVQGLDTMSLKTTEAVTPPTGKPMIPEASENSTILGGGLSDNIIYIGVPLCGLGILILLILCIICIRRKKSKAKGSPAKNRVQDLWVNNSRQDIPLTSRNTGPEQSSGEAALQDDIAKWRSGETNNGVRKRKGKNKKNAVDQKNTGLTEKEEGCTTYEAVFDYKGELSTHLQLKQGDLVKVHRKEAAGWWRGTVGDQTGWFPSNYVQAAPPDNFKTENEVEMHDDSYVSSFMVKRSEEPNQRQSCLLNELNHRKSHLVNDPNHRNSTPTEEEIQAEPIYCKIQPKDKRKSGADRSNSTTPTKSDIISPLKDTSLDEDSQYVALYPFVARVDTELTIKKGDIILCKECSDKNGWMRGINVSTKLEGWVPATYVKKVEKVEKVETPKLDLDPSSYKQLEVNVNMDERQDLVGIVHKAIHTFSAEKAGDLEFDTGDHITVFQVLENGWWLGCKDKTVGWFPGSFVEMIDQPSASPSPSPASSIQSPSHSPVPSEDSQPLLNDVSKTIPQSDIKPATQSKLKPVRKAPAPPTPKTPKSSEPHLNDTTVPDVEKKPESKLPTPGGSRLPKMSRPKVAPPLPPTQHSSDLHDPLYDIIDKADHKNDINTNISDKLVPNNNDSDIAKQTGPTSDGLYELIRQPDNGQNCVSTPKKGKIKPPVPKRYIKPKLVTVPKAEVQMPNKETLTKGLVNGDVMKLRPPPPPRPVAPKLGPIRAKLSEPKPLEDQIPSEEEDTFFNLTPQRKFDAFVCQDLDEQNIAEEDSPYRSLSSFGSFGVSSFGKPKESSFGKPKDVTPLKLIGKNQNICINGEAKDNNKSESIEELDANLNEDKINDADSYKETPSSGSNVDVGKNVNAENILNDDKNEVNITEKDNLVNTTAESQPKAKMGIPVTPKMKASRLAPPKSVSAKINEPSVGLNSDKIPTSPPEKASKLQKPTKVALSSKIPLSPKESPKKKPDETNLFHFPDSALSSDNGRNSADKYTVLDKEPIGHGDSLFTNQEYVIPNVENVEKVQSLNTDSFDNEEQNENIECRPRTESFDKRPVNDSLKIRPRTDSIENRPRTDSIENRPRTDSIESRQRTDSIGKPPVAPKPKSGLPKLAKLSSASKSKEDPVNEIVHKNSPEMENNNNNANLPAMDGQLPITSKASLLQGVLPPSGIEYEATHVPTPSSDTLKTKISEYESDTDNKDVNDKSKTVSPGSKLPLISAKTQQSPKSRGRKSNLPSLGFRNKSVDRSDKNVNDHKLSESESDRPLSPNMNIKQKPESPAPGRKVSSKQVGSVEKQSLRNRSNSPAGRSGIPTTIRNRSNSPAPKPGGIPVPTTNTPKNKQKGLVPPKKILNGQDTTTNVDGTSLGTSNQSKIPALNSPVKDKKNEPENDSISPKPDRPSKPPRVQKQKSQDSKPPKHGKSLLPVIHKAIEKGSDSPNGVSQTTPGTKPKRGIPVAKPARPSTSPKTLQSDQGEEIKRTLYQAVRGYTAQIDGELTFSEGTFIKELSDCDRPGWYVGMLADGTTGLYPADHFKPSPVSAQSEA